MLWSTAILLPILILVIYVACAVYVRNPRQDEHQIFFLYMLSHAVIIASDFALFLTHDVEQARLWASIGALWPLSGALLAHFLLAVSSARSARQPLFLVPVYLLAGGNALLSSIGLLRLDLIWSESGWSYARPPGLSLGALLDLAISLLVIVILIASFIRGATASSRIYRRRTLLLTAAVSLPVLATAFAYELTPTLTWTATPLPDIAIGLEAMLVAWTMWRYDLFSMPAEYLARRLHSSLFDAVLMLDEHQVVRQANPAALSMLEIPKEQILRQPLRKLLALDPSSEELLTTIAELDQGQQELRQSARLLWGPGEELPVTCTIAGLWTSGGIRIGSILVMRDLRDQIEAERRLLESEGRFRLLLDEVEEVAVIAFSQSGMIDYWNRGAEQLYGHSAEAARGADLVELLVPAQRRSRIHSEINDVARRRRGTIAHEETAQHKSGAEIPIFSNLAAVDSSNGVQLFRIDINLEKLQRAEREQARLQSRLQRSMRLESLGSLAGGVAHDFNNLLTAIIGAAELASSELSAEHPAQPDLREILSTTERASQLTRRLLAFGGQQQLQPRPLKVDGLLQSMEKVLRRLIRENIELVVRTRSGDAEILADPSQIEQVILNLVVNSRDAIGLRGSIRLTSELRDGRDVHSVTGELPPAERYLALVVEDDGNGIPPQAMEHIFEPFFSTKEQGKGTGLGLATVYGIVRQSGGAISVESTVGEGSRFQVLFPLLKPGEALDGVTDTSALSSSQLAGSETLLVVEDDSQVRESLVRALERKGYSIIQGANVDQALDRLRASSQSMPELVVSDVVMPGRPLQDLIAELRSLDPQLPFLFISGYAASDIGQIIAEDERMLLLHKPFRMQDLLLRIRQALDQRSSEL